MAKKAAKETSTPLVFALVFFVLTTIAFGVMWYMSYSDQQAKNEAVDKAKKEVSAANSLAKEAEQKAKLYAVYLGVEESGDLASMMAEHKAGDKLSTELKRINQKMAERLKVADPDALPPALQTWRVDAGGQIPKDGPTEGIVDVVSTAYNDRDAAIKNAADAAALYDGAVKRLDAASKALATAQDAFAKVAESLPKQFDTKFQAEIKKFQDRVADFVKAEASSRNEIEKNILTIGAMERDKQRQQLTIGSLQQQVGDLLAQTAKSQNNTFQYEEPQGKILRRLDDNVLEINIGSRDLVRPGLTFTVLPYDFPEKGRQSRMMVMRIPDERGQYKDVERFVPKATVEVIEVLGPNLSRARITDEFDRIRDGAAVGDLLYNAVWRKGVTDHIALLGIFDTDGDGTDDINAVIRDLTRMGIPVDAYYDLKERKWVGQINEQTRFIIEGWRPANSSHDPNMEDKNQMLAGIQKAVEEAKQKGVSVVGFRDFFPRMGYRAKTDITVDKLNQATAPYLNRTAAAPPPVAPGN